ncbi:glycosyltransferase [Companilactobacillus huachuanensis]|uniref:Glycosyltransferase n=1 Tax=Companilactobacillus huachuanensis TaxID=2559914 RepID=A0ABW1RK55_9LACO|nr:glycosyltransferase [Companilactobacillus huachuanensis]
MEKSVFFVASNPFNPDPRAEKQMITLLKGNYNVYGIGWDRDKNADYTYDMPIGIKVYEIGIKSSFGSGLKNLIPLIKFNIKLLFKLIKFNKKIDIIHSVNLDTGLVSIFFAKLFHKKIIYDIYDYYVDAFPVPNVLKKNVKKLEDMVISKSDLTVIPIDYRKSQIKDAKPNKLDIIYNTPNYSSSRNIKKYLKMYVPNKINISFVGALVPDRFLDELIDISKERNDVFFHIAGFGSENLVNKIKNSSSNIKFYGKVSYDDGLAISNISDIMIAMYNPSVKNHKYSAPNKFYEALFLGKPIVVSNGTGIDSFVKKYDVGYVVDYSKRSFELFLDSIDKANLVDFKKRNQALYKNKFSWIEMEKTILTSYKNL